MLAFLLCALLALPVSALAYRDMLPGALGESVRTPGQTRWRTPTDMERQPRTGRSRTPTPDPTPSPTPSPSPSPVPGGPNLLLNGDFRLYSATTGFPGWTMTKGFWKQHNIVGSQCDQQNPDWPDTMAEADIDKCQACNTWPPYGEDWLAQTVEAPAHSQVTLRYTEAHHMVSGVASIHLLGSHDGAAWETVWYRPAPEALAGQGHRCVTPPTFTHTFDAAYPHYWLILHMKMTHVNDGWIVGPISLTAHEPL